MKINENSNIFYRVSPRDPTYHPISKSDLKMWRDGISIIGSLNYWQFSNGPVDDLTNPVLVTGDHAVALAGSLFGVGFLYSEKRGLCYDGVAACRGERSVYEMINFDGSCYTSNEGDDTDQGKQFWVWKFEGEVIAPLPEGDGYVVKPVKVLERQCSQQFLQDMSQFDAHDLRRMLYGEMIQCCADLDDRFGNIWIKRFSSQYTLYEEYCAKMLHEREVENVAEHNV